MFEPMSCKAHWIFTKFADKPFCAISQYSLANPKFDASSSVDPLNHVMRRENVPRASNTGEVFDLRSPV